MFYRVVTGVVAQRLGDEMVLIHPKTDRIFLSAFFDIIIYGGLQSLVHN